MPISAIVCELINRRPSFPLGNTIDGLSGAAERQEAGLRPVIYCGQLLLAGPSCPLLVS